MRAIRATLLSLAAVAVAGCQVTLTLPPYVPITADEIGGQAEVPEFTYAPRAGIAANEVRENAVGLIYVTQPIAEYVSNAVRRELRQAGVSLRAGAGCRLSGTISDFAIESLGFNATFLSDITYVLRDSAGRQELERHIQNSFTTSKFVPPAIILASFQKSISDNVGRFIADPAVKTALSSGCRGPAVTEPAPPARTRNRQGN